jgi:predicted DNA-binding protein (MmcQ/YjbR family)
VRLDKRPNWKEVAELVEESWCLIVPAKLRKTLERTL